MDNITFDRFNELANIREPHSVSIFIPTHRSGKEVNEATDQKHLKNQIKKVREELRTYQLKDQQIDKILQPAEKLLDDTGFWSLQLEGLAIFVNGNMFEYYSLPVSFKPFTYVSDHFYLRPLIPYLNDDGRYYLLSLSLNNVKFFEGLPHNLKHHVIEELLPERLEEIVGFDYQQKNLQFRTGHTDSGQAMFHGHGAASEQAKKEMFKFFRGVNEGLMKFMYDKKNPLIVATVDYLFPIYRQANDYKYLYESFIPGNPEHEKPAQLHQKAKILLEEHFNRKKKEKIKAFEELLSNQRASLEEDQIVAAAINGRIDTLFVRKGESLWGLYDKETNTVKIEEEKSFNNACLLNFATVHTILNSGTVYMATPEEMPAPTSRLNALLRF